FADVVHLLADELAGLRGRRFPFALVLTRSFDGFFLGHDGSFPSSRALPRCPPDNTIGPENSLLGLSTEPTPTAPDRSAPKILFFERPRRRPTRSITAPVPPRSAASLLPLPPGTRRAPPPRPPARGPRPDAWCPNPRDPTLPCVVRSLAAVPWGYCPLRQI